MSQNGLNLSWSIYSYWGSTNTETESCSFVKRQSLTKGGLAQTRAQLIQESLISYIIP